MKLLRRCWRRHRRWFVVAPVLLTVYHLFWSSDSGIIVFLRDINDTPTAIVYDETTKPHYNNAKDDVDASVVVVENRVADFLRASGADTLQRLARARTENNETTTSTGEEVRLRNEPNNNGTGDTQNEALSATTNDTLLPHYGAQTQTMSVDDNNETTITSGSQRVIVTLLPNNNDDGVSSSRTTTTADDGAAAALRFVLSRREAYRAKGLLYRWKLRGVGYLYSHHDMAIRGEVPVNPVAPGRNVILLKNVLEGQQNKMDEKKNCRLLTIWVRVNGPELFAGSARPVTTTDDGGVSSCFWEFEFDLRIAGNYSVDARLLLWNGGAPVGGASGETCNVTAASPGDHQNQTNWLSRRWPLHQGFQGFKLYNPDIGCCEICARLRPYCKYWSSPALAIANPDLSVNGCELYFDDNDTTPEDAVPQSHLLQHSVSTGHPLYRPPKQHRRRRLKFGYYHGPPHPFPTSYFLGCGWSNVFTLDFPCLSGELEDKVYFPTSSFYFATPAAGEESTKNDIVQQQQQQQQEDRPLQLLQQQDQQQQHSQLPLCTVDNEHIDRSRGRWTRKAVVAEDNNNNTEHGYCPYGTSHDPRFNDFFGVTKFDGTRPWCWHMDDLSRVGNDCMEMNCELIPPRSKWISPVHLEKKWFGVWRPYDCDYVEFTNTQLQRCIDERKIASIQTRGKSIGEFINVYLQMRLAEVRLFPNKSDPGARHVVLDTLSLLHFGAEPIHKLETKLDGMVPVGSGKTDYFWVSGFYLSSERETHVTQARMEIFNRLAEDKLLPKGYRPINAYDATAAFAYDTATQFDGMHIIGPPMKTIVTKLFHHLCSGVVEGSRV